MSEAAAGVVAGHDGRAPAGAEAKAVLRAVPLPPSRPFEIFEAKLRRPQPPRAAVPRAGLVNRLRANSSVRLAIVVAPAGYGKSTALAQWAARDERPVAWLTLDERDNDPLILLRHLAVALERAGLADDAVIDAVAEPSATVWLDAAPRFATALSSSARPFALVLDESDWLVAGDAAELLAVLAEHVPPGSTLVLAGRETPVLPIPRLRAAGEVLELGARELALTPREAHQLVRAAGLRLEDATVAELQTRTEGWAAGLSLAVRSWEEAGRAALSGRNRSIADYVRSEQLSRLPADRLDFLLRTSVLERLSGRLCDTVTGRRGSKAVLAALARTNLFVVELDGDGEWYRYHGLFRDVLRNELELREPELVPQLELRAAEWLDAHGDREAALRHYQGAGQLDAAAGILAAIALPAYAGGRGEDVGAWLESFARDADLAAHPAAAGAGAWVHALRGNGEEAVRWVVAAGRAPAKSTLPDGTPVRAVGALVRSALCTEGPGQMARDAETALAALPAGSGWLPAASLLLGVAHALDGERELALGCLAATAEAAAAAGAADVRVITTAYRSLLTAESGDLAAAESLGLEARELLVADPVAAYPTSAIAHAAAARACLRNGQWDAARSELASAERLAAGLTDALPWLAVETRLALAAAYLTLRDGDRAAAALAGAEGVLVHNDLLAEPGARARELRRQLAELPAAAEGSTSGLTAAELRLLPLLATHLSFREIGERLYVSRNTIKTQAISTYRKLGVSSRSEAIARAFELGLVEDSAATRAEIAIR